MADTFEYLVGATAYIFVYPQNDDERFPDSFERVQEAFQRFYDKALDLDRVKRVVRELARLSFITLVEDRYAGEVIEANDHHYDTRYRFLSDRKYKKFFKVSDSAGTIYRKVLSNPLFWEDLATDEAEELAAPEPGELNVEEVPAADRVVTISHNSEEGQILELSVSHIVGDLETNNAVANEAGDERDRLIAEGKATHGLLKAERISLSNLRTLIWNFFQEVAKKFEGRAVEWSVDKALMILSKLFEMME